MIVAGMAMVTSNDAMVKHLTQVFGIGQIMFMRGVLVCAIFATYLFAKNKPVFSRRVFHRWNIVRALLELGATLMFLTGLSMLPLATASTLAFSSPIFLAILAALVLRERVGWLRWLMVLIGFVGVLMITNPFSSEASWAVIFPLVAAVFVALRDLAVRYVPSDLPSVQVAFTNAWVVMLGGAGLVFFQDWRWTEDISWYLWLIGPAAAMFCGYILYVVGTRLGELSFVAPFKYSSILLAIAIGYVVWGDVPSVMMLCGAAVIIVSGIVLLTSEKKRQAV